MFPQNQNQLSFMDALNVMSFMIGLENLQANLTQADKQELMDHFADRTDKVLGEIHTHLEEQDRKIDLILDILYGLLNETGSFGRPHYLR